MNEQQKIIYTQILSRYVKVTETHKIHECQADIYSEEQACNSKVIRILSSLTTTGAILALIDGLSPYWVKVITAFVAAVLSYYTLTRKELNAENHITEQKQYAALMHDLRNRYESLLTDIKAGILSDQQVMTRRQELEQRENEIYSGKVPTTSEAAVNRANEALKKGKESTTEAEEIKLIVPDYLKI